jgi:hypothetical protein
MASGSLHRIAQIAEATRGTTPTSTPAFLTLPDGRSSGQLTRTEIKRETLRSDRMILPSRLGKKAGQFSVPFELMYGGWDGVLEALFLSTWTSPGGVLTIGTTRHYKTIEEYFADAVDGAYHRHVGAEWNTMELSSDSDAIAKGSFGFVCIDTVIDDAALTGATYPTQAANANDAFVSYDGVITQDASPLAYVSGFKISINNGIELGHAWNEEVSDIASVGSAQCSGELSMRFTGKAQINKFLNETPWALSFTFTDPTGNAFNLVAPHCLYTGGAGVDVANGGLLQHSLPFNIGYNGSASPITITRTPHV